MKQGISVVLCCYNSSTRLPATLRHLALQRTDPFEWEIILIDNCSTDNTVKVARKVWAENSNLHVPFNIYSENRPGLSYAREKGIKEARYKYILFCDDDNWLSDNYLDVAFQLMEGNPLIGALGGQCRGATVGVFPNWFEQFKDIYAVGVQSPTSGYLTDRNYLWGAGLVIRRHLYLALYDDFPSLLSDRKGALLSSGGDSEICMRILMAGYKLYYSSSLNFVHFVSSSRLTVQYRQSIINGFKEPNDLLVKYYLIIHFTSLPFYRRLLSFAISLYKYIVSRFPGSSRWSTSYDAMIIHFIFGFKLNGLKEEDITLKQINVACKNFASKQFVE